MSTAAYSARFDHSADVIFGLLTDAGHHNGILPFCESVSVLGRRTEANGSVAVEMRHLIVIPRIAMETNMRSTLSYQIEKRSLEMVSYLSDDTFSGGGRGFKASGHVVPDGAGSNLYLKLDMAGLPLRYRILLVEPLLRRGHQKLVEKIARRAAEVASIARVPI